MENDTIKKIDEAINSIQKRDSDMLDKVEVKKDTDTKLFDNGTVDSSLELEKTKEFNGIVDENIEVDKQDDEDISLYVLYFASLIIVVVLVITFILFFYK